MRKIRLSTLIFIVFVSENAFAETPIIAADDFTLSTGAYLSSYFLYTQLDYDLANLPDAQASSSNLFRIESRGTIGEHFSFEIHNRLFLRSANTSAKGLGLGATQIPVRAIDLRSSFSDEGRLVEHDLDRLALAIFTPIADFTLGRQTITWGNSTFFALNDLWTQFSPFESDTSQKRGVDALRAITYPIDTLEIELILAAAEDIEDLAGGLKIGFALGKGDYYIAAARQYENIDAMAGAAIEIGNIRSHFDLNLPYRFDKNKFSAPSLSLGGDYFSSTLIIGAEYFFNGYGVKKERYLSGFLSARLQRAQAYLVGEHYLGANIGYLPIPEITLNLVTIANLLDPSAILSPRLSYQASTEATLSLGGFIGIGERPAFEIFPPQIRSEFGLSGYSVFLQVSTFL